MRPPGSRALAYVAWVSVCVFLLYLPISSRAGSVLHDDGDALQGVYVVGWVAHQVVNDPFALFDMNAYYPHPEGLVYQEHLIPHGIAAVALMGIGLEPISAFNFLVAITVVLIAVSVRLWARELGFGELAAATAGVVAALTTFTLGEAPRLQLLSFQWTPFALVCLHRFVVKGTASSAIGFAVCFVLQGLSSQYYLVSSILFFSAVFAVYLFLFPERRTLNSAMRLGIPLVAFGLLLVPIELTYLDIFTRYGFDRPLADGTDLARYLAAPASNYAYGWIFGERVSTLQGQHHHFIGYLALTLIALGAASLCGKAPNRKLVIAFASIGGLAAFLSAGAVVRFAGVELGPGPFRFLYDYIPVFHYTRAPGRLSIYFTLAIALLAGLGAAKLAQRCQRPALVVAAALILLPAEHARRWPFAKRIPTIAEFPAVYPWLGEVVDDHPIVEFPVEVRQRLRFHGYESYFSMAHWKPIPFAKPSFTPPAMEYLRWRFRRFPSRETTRLLQSLGVEMIVFHPRRHPNPRAVVRRLERDPNFTLLRRFPVAGEVAGALGYGEEVVFTVRPETMPSPPTNQGLRAIDPGSWRFETSSSVDPTFAIDGRVETAWSSDAPQEKGQFFEIDLGGEYRVAKISLGFVFPFTEFPRHLSVNGYHASHRWRRLELDRDAWRPAWEVERLVADPMTASMDLVLAEPAQLERIRLFIRETDLEELIPPWRIPEIHIFEQVE